MQRRWNCACCKQRYTKSDYYAADELCRRCASKMQTAVWTNRYRTRSITPEYHLITLTQWADTLHYFNFKCAYCQKKRYQVLEHFIPVSDDGLTTVYNCVPACTSCNLRKRENPYTPNFKCSIPGKDIERVREYLEKMKSDLLTYIQTVL